MALITPSYVTVNPHYMEPGIILPYSQASGAFATIAQGQPLPRLSDGDLQVYMKKIDIRTQVAAGNAAFQGQYINLGAAPWSTPFTAGATRKAMASLLTYVTDTAGGEAPTFVVMNPSDFATLDTDFIGTENTYTNPGASYTMDTKVRTAFPNLNVAGIPIFQDHFCPKGSMFGVNCKYTCMYLSEDAAFDFSGFYSLVPLGQMAQQGIVVLGYDVISAKSSSGFWAYNLAGGAF